VAVKPLVLPFPCSFFGNRVEDFCSYPATLTALVSIAAGDFYGFFTSLALTVWIFLVHFPFLCKNTGVLFLFVKFIILVTGLYKFESLKIPSNLLLVELEVLGDRFLTEDGIAYSFYGSQNSHLRIQFGQ